MSKLEELIQQYCPDGVEYARLGDFATQWYRGAGIKKDEVGQEGIPCIRYGEIHTAYKIWFDKCVSHTDEAKQPSKKYADYGDILFAITSEDIPFIGNSVAYVGKERIMVGGDIVVMKHTQNPKYISYALSTIDAVGQKGKGKVKSKVVHTNVPSLKEIVIPLPPLPVQEEIVRILDNFTELQAELQAELQKRKQQYNYYLDNLLNFKNINRGGQEIKWMKMSEICIKISSGGTPSRGNSDYFNGDIPWLRTQEVNRNDIYDTEIKITKEAINKSAAKLIPKNCVIIAMYGATAGKTCINKIPLTTNQACCNLQIDANAASYKYVYYCVCNDYEKIKSLGQGSQHNINAQIIKDYIIPVPPLAEQNRIVAILDRFDTLTTDLTQGLPAEIEKRRQQYEFYRDKLLTFKRKEA